MRENARCFVAFVGECLRGICTRLSWLLEDSEGEVDPLSSCYGMSGPSCTRMKTSGIV